MRHLISFIILILATLGLKAQFSVGFRAGYGSHGIHLEPPQLEKFQVPYFLPNAGLVIIYNNTNNAGLQMEFNYAPKGWMEKDTTLKTRNLYAEKGDTITSTPYFKRTINYLEVPFFSHWEAGYGPVRIVIFAGPYLALKLSETYESDHFSHLWYDGSNYNQYDQKAKQIDFGIKAGLGLRYNINRHFAIYIDARYDAEIAGGRDIFINRPDGIRASRLKEIGGTFGILWHIIPQKEKKAVEGYQPKENLYGDD